MGNTACCSGTSDKNAVDVANPNDKTEGENPKASSRKEKLTPRAQSKKSSARKEKSATPDVPNE
jgi:hypothetical protein